MTLRQPTRSPRRRARRLAPVAVAVCAALAMPATAAPAKPASEKTAKASKSGKASSKPVSRKRSAAPAVPTPSADAASSGVAADSPQQPISASTGFVGVRAAAAAPATAAAQAPSAKHTGMNAAFVGMPLDTATAPTPAPPPAAAPTQVALALAPRGLPSFAPAPAAPVAEAAPGGSATTTQPPVTATRATSTSQSTAPAVAASRKPSDAPVTGNALADPVIRLLHARGLLPSQVDASGSALLTKVRDATSSLVTTAMNFIGVRYTWGGTSVKTGFDCSGFTRFVFDKSLGVALPRRAVDQARSPDLQRIDQSNLKPGDLVFFNTLRSAFSHVGIYVGEGKFIHAPRTGSHVRVDNMDSGYWAQRFNGARRAPQAQLDAAELEDVVRSAEER